MPINSPVHVQVRVTRTPISSLSEVVRSIRVLEGPYDRPGDTAVFSAYFDLGVTERAKRAESKHGSFNQARVVNWLRRTRTDDQTFAAVFAAQKLR